MLRRPSADDLFLIVARRIIHENDCIRAQLIDQKRQGRIPRQRLCGTWRAVDDEQIDRSGQAGNE